MVTLNYTPFTSKIAILMARILLIAMLLISTTMANCQILDSTLAGKTNREIANYYIDKSKANNTAGWLLIGTGVVFSYIGFSYAMNHLFEKENQSTVLLYTSVGMSLGSIFVFEAARNHKRMATFYLEKDPNAIPVNHRRNLNLTVSLPLSR